MFSQSLLATVLLLVSESVAQDYGAWSGWSSSAAPAMMPTSAAPKAPSMSSSAPMMMMSSSMASSSMMTMPTSSPIWVALTSTKEDTTTTTTTVTAPFMSSSSMHTSSSTMMTMSTMSTSSMHTSTSTSMMMTMPMSSSSMHTSMTTSSMMTMSTPPMVHTVNVSSANGTLMYYPEIIIAEPGSIVEFIFFPKNHTVTQSTFMSPCMPMLGGKNSGFMPTSNTMAMTPSFSFQINDTNPIWLYCAQIGHCAAGMSMVINEDKNSNMTLLGYQAAAAKLAMTATVSSFSAMMTSSKTSSSSSMMMTSSMKTSSSMMMSSMMTSSMKMNTTSMMMMGTATSKMNSTMMMTMTPAPLATFHGAASRKDAPVGGLVGLVVAVLGLLM